MATGTGITITHTHTPDCDNCPLEGNEKDKLGVEYE